ncbi:ThiF family adenylyltransferase [Candidatus Woesearchaeota archaeon]|nr:ThiF family adenylyltransferase [Candidatus Woesearchaeota archaeon]
MLMKKRFAGKRVAIVGAGTIGCLTAAQLANEGIAITIIDRDFVEPSNLDRQLLYTSGDIGAPKAVAAKKKLNSKVKAVVADLDYRNASLLSNHNLILDCTDNMETRFLINDYCKANSIPWIYAAAIRDTGTVYTILPDSACFRCIFRGKQAAETCDTAGIIMGVASAVAASQAEEAVNILINGKPSQETMLRINFTTGRIMKLKTRRKNNCPACNGNYEYLTGKKGSKITKLCGTGTYQIKGKPVNLNELAARLKAKSSEYCIYTPEITIFKDGRAIIKAETPEKAKAIYSRITG